MQIKTKMNFSKYLKESRKCFSLSNNFKEKISVFFERKVASLPFPHKKTQKTAILDLIPSFCLSYKAPLLLKNG